MSREIMFRAWCRVRGGWVYFSLEDLTYGEAICHEGLDIDNESWAQFTGLKDCNGLFIYEGDILAKKSLYESQGFGLQVVEHENKDVNKCFGHGSFGDNAFSGFEISSYYGQPRELEIIGNIYENPELLNP